MNTNQTKNCTSCSKEFIIDVGDLDLYEKVGLKVPDKCFECRTKQFFAFSVFGKFRKGVSDLSGESFITVRPLFSRTPIYSSAEWRSDVWDPLDYGQVYDSTRPFFDQLKELQEKIPRPHQIGENSVQCDWSDDAWESKNCYLCRSLLKCENLSYAYRVVESKDSVGSFFLYDCRNSQNCFMSCNLRNKQYCIRNIEYSREEYFSELAKIDFGSYENIQFLKEEFLRMVKEQAIHRENFNIKTTKSIGNYLTNCDQCVNVYAWENSQNCRNCIRGLLAKDCIDQAFTWNTEVSGNNGAVDGGYAIKHSACSIGKYSEYLDLCKEVEYCFGCIGLRNKKYCILNKQYSKEDYETLRAKIVSDMGDEYGNFMPYSMGLCDYNFSTGIIYFPNISKDEILNQGGYWSDEDLSSSDGVSSLTLPDHISQTDASACSQALICPETEYRFNISQSELEFHKRKNFALPRIHFDRRILSKAAKMSAIQSYPYTCCYCSKDVSAYYPTEWGYQNIACEECYKQNIS